MRYKGWKLTEFSLWLLTELIGGKPRVSDTVKHLEPLYTVSAHGWNSVWVFANTNSLIKVACKITPNGIFFWPELHFKEQV